MTLFVVALAYRARRPSTVAAAIAGASLGVAASLHLASLIAFPIGAIVARGSWRHPFSLAAFMLAFGAAFLWESQEAVAHLTRYGVELASTSPIIAGAGLLIWLGAGVAHHRCTKRWPRSRVIATLACLAAPSLALVLGPPEVQSARYYAISILALGALFGEFGAMVRVRAPSRVATAWIVSAVLWGSLFAGPVTSALERSSRPDLCRAGDVEVLASNLDRVRVGYSALARGVRGPGSSVLALQLAATRPLTRLSDPPGSEAVFVACVPSDVASSAPIAYARVPLPSGRVGLLHRYEGRVSTDRFELCVPGSACAAGEVDPSAVLPEQGAAALANRMPVDIAHALSGSGRVRRGEPLRFRLPIAAGSSIGVRFAPGSQVESIEGVEGAITGRDRFTLSGEGTGSIVVQTPFEWARFGYSPPDLVETPIAEADWLDALPWSSD